MPKTKGAKKALSKFKKQYGDKKGEQVYYATANKQDRNEKTFKKESKVNMYKLLEDLAVNHNDGSVVMIKKGTEISEMVGTGGIAMVPNALGEEPPKKKKKKKNGVREASNSQVSTLAQDH